MTARRKSAHLRVDLEARIEEMIALLDTIDGDPDLEDGADDEPSLGGQAKFINGQLEYDLEGDAADEEPSLGWTDNVDQAVAPIVHNFGGVEDGEPTLGWCGHGRGCVNGESVDDREEENEHRDDSDCELSLGWSEHQSLHGCIASGDEFPRNGDGPMLFDGSGNEVASDLIASAKPRIKPYSRIVGERDHRCPDGKTFTTFVPY